MCHSNAVTHVAHDCWQRTLSIAVLIYFLKDTFKNLAIAVIAVVLIQLFSLNVGSKQKIKMKTQNASAPLYQSKVSSTQSKAVPFFPCLTHEDLHVWIKKFF